MKKSLLILVFQLACITTICAQNYKFGKVSKEELQEKMNALDTTANATILYHKENISYTFTQEKGFEKLIEVHRRIKIYNKDGFDWAEHSRSLYDENSSTREDLVSLKAVTYNLEGGKIVESKMKRSGVFEEKESKYWKKKTFTLPNVKEGSVLEYTYKIRSPFLTRIDDIFLQQSVPIKELNVEVKIPDYFKFKKYKNLKSNVNVNINREIRDQVLTIKSTARSGDTRSAHLYRDDSKFEYKEEVNTIHMQNVPAQVTERYAPNLRNYVAKLSFELLTLKGLNHQITNYATDWETVTSKIYKSEGFGGQLAKSNYFKEDLEMILKESTSDVSKIINVFEFVKAKIKWNGGYGVYAENGVKKAYKEEEGNVADVNLTLVTMLRHAGIKANPILISTKSNGIPLFPTRQGFNYVICGVEMPDGIIIFDATEKYAANDILPERALNWQGRIIREHGSSTWVDLLPNTNSVLTTMISASMDEEFIFSGKSRSQRTNYLAYNYRDNYNGVVKEDLVKEIAEGKGEIEITDLKIDNQNDLGKPIMQTYAFSYEDGAEEIGSEIYVSPLLFLSETENIFNQEKRSYPIDFSFPMTRKIIINMNVPEGYKIKSLPESIKMVMTDNLGEYGYLVKQLGNKIQVSQTFKINYPLVPVSYYQDLKEIYKKLIEKNSEKIVLEKV